jgi:hypothetical protein
VAYSEVRLLFRHLAGGTERSNEGIEDNCTACQDLKPGPPEYEGDSDVRSRLCNVE